MIGLINARFYFSFITPIYISNEIWTLVQISFDD